MKARYFPAVLMVFCWPSISTACPPPPAQNVGVEQNIAQTIGESNAAYFKRLTHIALPPNSFLTLRPALQGPTESDDDYQVRLEDFEVNRFKAIEQRLVQQKSQEIANAAALWDEAPQILIAHVDRSVDNDKENRKMASFTVIDREKGDEVDKSFDIVSPLFPGPCGIFYPSYREGDLLVFFALAGPISINTVIAQYTSAEALDDRTRGWLAAHRATIEGAHRNAIVSGN